jgi:hypothetical protein
MADYQKHLYMIVFPNNALVSSQLEPKEFAAHYTYGSRRHFRGKVIFAELDINFRNEHFDIDKYLEETVPHDDGKPKRTKFIASYRVLEHVPLSAMQKLYLVTTDGHVLGLDAAPYVDDPVTDRIRLYQEITPLTNLVASKYDQRHFGKQITQKNSAKGAPKVCFTQFKLDVEHFVEESKNRDILVSPIPENNPYRLLDCLKELIEIPAKMLKTITLSSALGDISYRLIDHGFWFFDEDGEILYYPMPAMSDIEENHYDFYRHMR